MQSRRFDALATLIGRRGVLASLLGMAGIGGALAMASAPAAAASFCIERPTGGTCKKNGQCCSNDCKKKKGHKRGRCRCSGLRAGCSTDTDCCGFDPADETSPFCGFTGGNPNAAVCCASTGGTCTTRTDCCNDGLEDCVQGVCTLP